MIEKITLRNFLSFKNETVFDFTASQEKPKEGFEYMNWYEEINKKKILKTIFLFGNNGTGKSNLIKAINTLRSLVCIYSKSKSDEKYRIPDFSFKFSKDTYNKPSLIKIIFNTADIRYLYEIEWTDNLILHESLHKGVNNPHKLFDRTYDNEKGITNVIFPYKGIGSEAQSIIKENAINNSSVISVYDALNLESADLRNVFNYFLCIRTIQNLDKAQLLGLIEDRKDGLQLKKIILDLLQDLGSNITDYEIDKIDVPDDAEMNRIINLLRGILGDKIFSKRFSDDFGKKFKSIRFSHPTDESGQKGWLHEQNESLGSINMIKLIIVLYDSCKYQTPIFIDECSYGIHQMTFGRIIQFFLAISHHSQAIMASQNLAIMEMEGFRRDTIRIFDKDRKTGETFCDKIDLRKYHKNLNIVKTYLNNSFGSLPDFPTLDIWKDKLKTYSEFVSSTSPEDEPNETN